MKKKLLLVVGMLGCLWLVPRGGWGLTPLELKGMLERGEPVTVIDIRTTAAYAEGHIQGAINVPAEVLKMKRLPPLGAAVVCGDGIRTDLAVAAVEELNTRNGITAERLEGGLPAWDALNLTTTHRKGLGRRLVRYLNREELEKAVAGNPDLVLVDLRVSWEKARDGKRQQGVGSAGPPMEGALTDIDDRFPGKRIIKPIRLQQGDSARWDFSSHIRSQERRGRHQQLYVLIDNGDGASETAARQLAAAGIKRVAILVGGERALSPEGAPGIMVK